MMKKAIKTQSGFAVFEILFFLLLTVVLIGVAYYVGKNNNKASTNSKANSSVSSAAANTKSQSATKADKELIVDAVVANCVASDSSTDQQLLKTLLTNTYNSSDSTLKIEGNYATAGAACSANGPASNPSPVEGEGFQVWLKKATGTWEVAFKGQQAPGCSEADGEAWPEDILMCVDDQTGNARATKS
jgi:hypothetical protein